MGNTGVVVVQRDEELMGSLAMLALFIPLDDLSPRFTRKDSQCKELFLDNYYVYCCGRVSTCSY